MAFDFSGIPPELLEKDDVIKSLEGLVTCEVHDVIAYGRCYVVKAAGMARMPAMLGSLSSSMLPTGARDIAAIIPGAIVLCWTSKDYLPVILSVLSAPMGGSAFSWPDFITAASHAGFASDAAHQLAVTKESGHGLFDLSAGSPIDAVPGDWGHINELGMGFFLGRLMSFMRAGDLCKMEMFYTDMLARLYSYNWQQYTAGSSVEAFNDEGEWTSVKGFTPFPWETSGVRTLATGAFRDVTDATPFGPTPEMGVEPANVAQAPLFRMLQFSGFLGDLHKRYVVTPTTDIDVMTYGRAKGSAPAYKGLFEEVIGLDGSYSLRSAKSIGFEKTCWIPVPEQRYTPDNPNGDNELENVAGVGLDQSEYPAPDNPHEFIARADDMQAHLLNKQTSEGVNNRSEDWAVADGDDLAAPGDFTTEEVPLKPYSTFENNKPESKTETLVEDSGREATYYQGKAFMGILPDGSILMRDAYGAELRLTGGNIEITCPGDIIARSGRRLQVWAGKDLVMKAYEDIDVSAAKGSVRVKAEHNLMAMGGNDGTGGVLVESRGKGDPDFSEWGVNAQIGSLVIKSSRGKLLMYGDEAVQMQSIAGPIVINSKGGTDKIYTYASSIKNQVTADFDVLVAPRGVESDEKTISSMSISPSGFTCLCSTATIGAGTLSVFNHKGSGSGAATAVTMKAAMFIVGGAVASLGFGKADVTDTFSNKKSEATELISSKNISYRNRAEIDYTAATSMGNETVYALIGVSFRDTTDLALGSMYMLEADWQKRFRIAAGKTASEAYTDDVWVEPIVAARVLPSGLDDIGSSTMPFPGKTAWEDGTDGAFVKIDDVLRQDGRPIGRGDKGVNYNNVQPATPVVGAFKDAYPINP